MADTANEKNLSNGVSIKVEDVSLGYGKHSVIQNMNVSFDKAEVVSIIGPNGSGKSTLLKSIGRLLAPTKGVVYMNGKDIKTIASGEIAKLMSILPQSAQAPGDMTVRDLASCGRMPYQSAFSQLKDDDQRAIDKALKDTGLFEMQHRRIGNLSGGERQRAWLSMALAQEPQVLLLDEPTTYLDIHYQLELMELVSELHEDLGITVIMVMHDLNHAARFSHRLIAVKKGEIAADGPVKEVFTKEVLEPLYDVKVEVLEIGESNNRQLACVPYRTERRG